MKKLVALLLSAILCLSMVVVPALADGTPSVCIVVAGSFGDRSFYDSSKEGIDALAADFGTVTGALECKEDASLYETYLFDAAEQYDIVAAVGWQFWDALAASDGVLDAFPDVKFLFIDNDLDPKPENLMPIVYAQNEGSFLVGYIAAKLSQTGVIGAVGGEDSDTINDFLIGYKAGAEYANPEIKVEFSYTNDFEDPAAGKEHARALYDKGCDIVYQVAGKTGEGVFEAAAEVGKYAIGVDGDQKFINPDVIICSMVKRVGASIYDVVANPDEVFTPGQTWSANMADGYIDVVYGTDDMPQQVSAELKAEVEQLKALIVAGEIVVPSVFN